MRERVRQDAGLGFDGQLQLLEVDAGVRRPAARAIRHGVHHHPDLRISS
jgi:hypothetical protein